MKALVKINGYDEVVVQFSEPDERGDTRLLTESSWYTIGTLFTDIEERCRATEFVLIAGEAQIKDIYGLGPIIAIEKGTPDGNGIVTTVIKSIQRKET